METSSGFDNLEESGLIFVLSEPGTGKTSLLMAMIKYLYATRGRKRLKQCCNIINEFNKTQIVPFGLPIEPPFYTSRDCPAKFKVGYEKYYEPNILNPYYLGVNSYTEAQFLYPYSVVAIPEFQKYTNSRRGQSLPERFYRVFEIHRHWQLLFLLDGHKGSFIDLRCRALTRHIIEIQRQEHVRDSMNRITQTTWYCREFCSIRDYDDYIAHGAETYRETKYVNYGNIFKCYNSFSNRDEFIPPSGKTFSALKPLSQSEINKLPSEISRYYALGEPTSFRGKEENPNEKKSDKKDKQDERKA